jgi:ribosome-associated toxin RatA of RatAB toxin-antitoxin module
MLPALPLIVVAWGLVLGAVVPPPPGRSDGERKRVASGEVVLLDALPPGAGKSARGGTGVGFVRAPTEQVWRVIVDYRGHTRFYPRVVGVDVVRADEKHALVRYDIAIGPLSFTFHMNKYPDPARHRTEWHLAPDHANRLFRENSGYWQVDEATGGSLVTYAIAVRTVLPSFATFGNERSSIVDTIEGLRKVVEEGGGSATRP